MRAACCHALLVEIPRRVRKRYEGLGIKDVYLAAAVKTLGVCPFEGKNMDCRMRRYSIWAMIFPIMK